MGIFEIFLAGMCLNATCMDDEVGEGTIIRREREHYKRLVEDLRNDHLKITTIKNGELSGYTLENGTLVGTGVAFDIIKIMQDKYGFNYTITLPEDQVFNSKTNKGMRSMLTNGDADIAAAFLPSNTAEGFEYSRSFGTADWVVLMRRPKESATGSGLLAPFTGTVWTLIILSVLVVGPILYGIITLRTRLCKNDENNKNYELPACMWFVYGALLKQGSTLNPTTDSSRLLFSTWWLFITILTAFYTANLTAFLTLSRFTLPITRPSDILKKHYKWVTNRGNGITEEAVTSLLVSDIGRAEFVLNRNDSDILGEYVTKRNYMYIRERTVLEYVMYDDYKRKAKAGIGEEKRCTFVITTFPVANLPRSFAFSKGFKYKELFDSTIQYLVESGIVPFRERKELPDSKICPLNLGNTERQLKNADLMLTYMIVGGGLCISGVVFLLEIFIHLLKKPRKPPPNGRFVVKNTVQSPKTFATPPPSYHTLFEPPFPYENKRKTFNGREYWVVSNKFGVTELIPHRAPSALLFQFAH